jgi:hypothetical protein
MDIVVTIINILVIIVFVSSFMRNYLDPTTHIRFSDFLCMNDIFDREEECEVNINVVGKKPPVVPEAKKAARKTAEEQLKERNIDPQWVSDCIKVLQKLGTDKRQAKYIVNTEFGKDNPPTSVQIFLQKAFKQ